jgi:peptidoglycan/xylan/chitin deacetylase (PgdA/CDA1 family)
MIFPDILWKVEGSKSIFLTFDDGPTAETTPRLLDTLQELGVNGTFFLLGQNAAGNGELVASIHEHGHLIGNHAFKHRRLPLRSGNAIREEILRTEEIIFNITGQRTRMLRPPFGWVDGRVLNVVRELGYKVVLWSILSGDFGEDAPRTVVNRVVRNAQPGSIVVFHDNHKTKSKLIPIVSELIVSLRGRGFGFSNL